MIIIDTDENLTNARITENTIFFDLECICDSNSGAPSLDDFIDHMIKLKIEKTSQIVCYDSRGMETAARVAWLLRYFGALNVRILNGGFKKWVAEGRNSVCEEQEWKLQAGGQEVGDYSYSFKDPNILTNDQ